MILFWIWLVGFIITSTIEGYRDPRVDLIKNEAQLALFVSGCALWPLAFTYGFFRVTGTIIYAATHDRDS